MPNITHRATLSGLLGSQWGWKFWQQRASAIVASIPPPPNFQTCGEPHRPHKMALQASTGPQAGICRTSTKSASFNLLVPFIHGNGGITEASQQLCE